MQREFKPLLVQNVSVSLTYLIKFFLLFRCDKPIKGGLISEIFAFYRKSKRSDENYDICTLPFAKISKGAKLLSKASFLYVDSAHEEKMLREVIWHLWKFDPK